jgi:hypothetical protein
MLLAGGHALLTGLRYRLGYYKSPYFARPSLRMYAELGISGGFLFLVLSVSSLLTRDIEVNGAVTTAVSLLSYIGMAAVALNWLLGLTNSRFLKPDWAKWLEGRYEQQQIEQLQQSAWERGLKAWEDQVRTRPELEAWVMAVLDPKNQPAQSEI